MSKSTEVLGVAVDTGAAEGWSLSSSVAVSVEGCLMYPNYSLSILWKQFAGAPTVAMQILPKASPFKSADL